MTTVEESRPQAANVARVHRPSRSPNPPAPQSQGDINSIFVQYLGVAQSVARKMLGNEHDAEEAVQDAFLSAYRALPKFKGNSKMSTWLYRIVVNACLMKMRQDSRVTRYAAAVRTEDTPARDLSGDPERCMENNELGDLLSSELARLAPESRSAVLLRYYYGLSNVETSERLQISVPALKSRLHRARVHLRERLRHQFTRDEMG